MTRYTTRTLLGALFCFSMVTNLGCVGDAELDGHADEHSHSHEIVRDSEILYVMDEQEADERFAPGQADFIPVNAFEQIEFVFTAEQAAQTQVQIRDEDGTWGAWQPLEMDWSEGEFHNAFIDLGEGAAATGLRLKGLEGLAFARLEFLGEAVELEQRPELVSELRRPGKWSPSAEVLAAGSRQYLPYEAAGTRCSGGMTPGAVELGRFIKANFPGVASVQGYNCRTIGGSSTLSLHGVGRALDIMIPVDGSWSDRGSADNDKGDPIADWLIANAETIGIQYIVWDRRSWGAHRSGNKLRDYGGQHAHHDHLHIELTTAAARKATPFFGGSVPPINGTSTTVSCKDSRAIGPQCAIPSGFQNLVGDFNGDGKKDVAVLSANGAGAWNSWYAMDLSKGNGFNSTVWGSATPQHMRNGVADSNYRALVGDFNGDGKDDVATIGLDAAGGWRDWIAMDLSRGSSFRSTVWGAATPVHIRNGSSSRDYRTLVGDFNGDGKDDIATVSLNGGGGWADWIAMELSTGSGFRSKVWGAKTPRHIRNGGANNDYRVLVGDFNGDGKDDIATITRDGNGGWRDWVAVELSTGSGFASKTWRAATPIHMRNGGASNDYRVLVGDFNGDGKDDLATMTRNGGGGWADWAALELSTGNGFASKTWRSKTPQHMRNGGAGNDYRILVGDVNGDGKDDLLTLSPNGAGSWSRWASVDLSSGSGFNTREMTNAIPQHIRNGDSKREYRAMLADFTGDGKADLNVLSIDGGGAWKDWYALAISKGTSMADAVWRSSTPQHIRNGNVK